MSISKQDVPWAFRGNCFCISLRSWLCLLWVVSILFSNQKTCPGGVGAHGLAESFLDSSSIVTDHNGWSQPDTQWCFRLPLLHIQTCWGVRFALIFARVALVHLLVQGLEKMALALVELEQLWLALHCLWETWDSWLGDKDLCQGKDTSQKCRQSSRSGFVEFELAIKAICRSGLNKVGAGIKPLMVVCMGIVSALLNSHCAISSFHVEVFSSCLSCQQFPSCCEAGASLLVFMGFSAIKGTWLWAGLRKGWEHAMPALILGMEGIFCCDLNCATVA